MSDGASSGKRSEAAPVGLAAVVTLVLGSALIGERLPAASPSGQHAVGVTATESERAAGKVDTASAKTRVAELLEEYFAEPVAPQAQSEDDRLRAVAKLWMGDGGRVVVATMPDPIEARVGYTFDQQLDALISGASAVGYTLDSFWLPWRVTGEPPELLTEVESDAGSLSQRSVWKSPRSRGHTQPGAILFRCDADRQRGSLLVLVVGESPTGGVHPAALRKALEIASELGGDGRITVVGPTYSGGARSVARVAERWRREGRPSLRIISGTLTSDSAAEVLRGPDGGDHPGIEVELLDVPVAWTLEVALDFVTRRSPRPVALLAEQSTYGGSARAEKTGPVDVIHYPLHIAQVRNAHGKAHGRNGGPRIRSADTRDALELPLGTFKETEIPPSFLPENAANVSERVLSQILEALEAQSYGSIGILGSDAYDRIFLARLVRRHLPDAQLFTIGSDALYLHPAHTADLLGMWVVSADPTDPSTVELWGDDVGRSSPSFAAAGFRRAVQLALGDDTVLPRGGVWISAVGRSGFWPVEFRDIDQPNAANFRGHQERHSTRPSLGAMHRARRLRSAFLWLVLASGGMFLCALGGIRVVANRRMKHGQLLETWAAGTVPSLVRALRSPRLGDPEVGWLAQLLPESRETTDLVWRWSSLALPLLLVGYLLWLSLPVLGRADPVLRISWGFALLAALGLLATTVLAGLWRGTAKRGGGAVSAPPRRIRQVAAAVMVIGLVGCVAIDPPRYDDLTAWLRFERAANLGSGLSPVIPAVLVTAALLVIVLAASQRSRLRCYAAGAWCVVPKGDRDSEMKALRATARALRGLIGGTPNGWDLAWRLGVPVLVTGSTLLLLWGRHTTSLDGLPYDAALYLAILILVFATTDGWMQFLVLWHGLRLFLRATAATSLVTAFDELPGEVGLTFGLGLRERPLDVTQVESRVEALERLTADLPSGGDLRSGLQEILDELKAEVHALDRAKISAAPALFATRAGDLLAAASGLILDHIDEARSSHRWQRKKLDDRTAAADTFVAMELTRLISFAFAILKNRALSCTAATALLFLAVASYPLQPQHRLLTLALLGLIVTAAAILRTLVQIDRDEVLSRIANRTPNRVNFDRDFFALIATYAGIPLLSLLVTGLPALTQQLSRLSTWFGD
jgi:hypothetical protein